MGRDCDEFGDSRENSPRNGCFSEVLIFEWRTWRPVLLAHTVTKQFRLNIEEYGTVALRGRSFRMEFA
jgi:hypothetical protein